MIGRMLRTIVGDDVFDVVLVLSKTIAEKSRAPLVLRAWWIDCRNADEVGGELNDLACGAIDFGHHTIDGVHGLGLQ